MASPPQIDLRDGSGTTQNLVLNTNLDYIFITGTVSADTAAVQVSVNGGAFTTDPNYVKVELNEFTVPNPSSYPSGLFLNPGVNTIQIRVIDIVGSVSPPAIATITRVRQSQVGTEQIPTGIRVRRRRDSVDILAQIPIPVVNTLGFTLDQTKFLGFNYYASRSAAGSTGYYRINEKLVTEESSVYEEDIGVSYDDLATWEAEDKYIRIRVSEEDEFGNESNLRMEQVYSANDFTNKVRFTSTLEGYQLINFATFRHYRIGGAGIINEDQFAGVDADTPIYYVVTGVYYDPTTATEVETPYSQEVLGQPLIIDTNIRDLPGRTQLQIITDYITTIQQVNAEISLIPGSTTRDVSIDPFASESERLWFLLDFVHRSQSFLTLLQIDDANGDGVSDQVSQNAYKLALRAALGYTSDQATQTLIDQQFEKLAKNLQQTRLPGRPSVGQAVIFTYDRPTIDIQVPSGSFVSTDADEANNLPSVRFRIGGTYVLPAASADSFYNFDTKRYELIVDVVCETVGVNGNRPAGSIKTITGVSGVSVTNTEATVFGTDIETNAQLAERCILIPTSVDTGTEGGYYLTAASQVGIIKTKVVKSGDPLMMRDWDDVRIKHIGGKVDVWIQGVRERQVTETFAFAFEIARDIQCAIVDITNLVFRVMDSRVTPETPIIEILNNPIQGFGVRNATAGEDYDLTGVAIIDYQTFQINTSIAQPTTYIDDVILADYRYRSVDKFYPTLQPVRRVTSIVGEVAGSLDPENNYALYKTDDPLLTGESTIAKDYVSITQYNGSPSGNQITINNEVHVMIGFVQEPLDSIGINTATIRVFSEDRLTEYDGPTASIPDFDIVPGTATTPVKIVRTASSTIVSGQTVSVDYIKDENFTITYVVNDLLQNFQQVLNIRRHTTADVLAKQSINNEVELETTIQLERGAAKDKVDPLVRTNLSVKLNQKTIGQGVAQSEVIEAIDSTEGVNYEIVPLARMAYADGSRRIREGVLSSYDTLNSLDQGAQKVYILINPLVAPTTDGGGLATEHKGVFQDDVAMTLVSTLSTVGLAANQAFIIGSGGVIITGYSDDATLTAEGFTTPEAREAERLRRTANHVVVALLGTGTPLDLPDQHDYAVSYIVRGDSGARDVQASDVEYVELGALTVTYREATT
jgi:hypothetical protein